MSSTIKININGHKGGLTNDGVPQYFTSSSTGSLEDWDIAVQKTETRLNRINEQRAKVRAHIALYCAGVSLSCFWLMLRCSALLLGS